MKKQIIGEEYLKGLEKLKKFSKIATPTVALMAMLLSSPVNEVKAQNDDNLEKEVIVLYKNEEGKNLALESGMKVDETLENLKMITGEMRAEDIKKLEKDKNIIAIEENIPLQVIGRDTLQPVNHVSYPKDADVNWGLDAMNIKDAWTDGYTGKGVKIAIIDSGIDPHSDLNIAGGISMIEEEGENNYRDIDGHGTHIAGIIAGKLDGKGVAGLAYDSEIYAVRVMNNEGKVYVKDVVEGIEWAINNGIDIINLSLATSQNSTTLEQAIKKAYNQGILIVAGVGNSGSNSSVAYPAMYDEVIAVTAVDKNMTKGSFASTGNKVEFSAPGVDIVSTYKDGKYAVADGTSQATPHVTALLAILKEKYPHYSNDQLRSELLKYVFDIGVEGRDSWYGHGFIQYLSEPNNIEEPIEEEEELEEPIDEENEYEEEPVREEEEEFDEEPVDEEEFEDNPIDEDEEEPIVNEDDNEEEQDLEEEGREEDDETVAEDEEDESDDDDNDDGEIEEEPIDEEINEDPEEENEVEEEIDEDNDPVEEEVEEDEKPVEEETEPADDEGEEEDPVEEDPVKETDPVDEETGKEEEEDVEEDEFIDSDDDGYSDEEEIEAGSDPFDPKSTPLDRDGDGYTNEEELEAGSNPDNLNSTPIDKDGDGVPVNNDLDDNDPTVGEAPVDSDGNGYSDEENSEQEDSITTPNEEEEEVGIPSDADDEPTYDEEPVNSEDDEHLEEVEEDAKEENETVDEEIEEELEEEVEEDAPKEEEQNNPIPEENSNDIEEEEAREVENETSKEEQEEMEEDEQEIAEEDDETANEETPIDETPVIEEPKQNVNDKNNNYNRRGSDSSYSSSYCYKLDTERIAIRKARMLVYNALAKGTYESLNKAIQEILKIENKQERDRLVKKITPLVYKLGKKSAKAVIRYEKEKTLSNYIVAKLYVEKLVHGKLKTELEIRLLRALFQQIKEASAKVEHFNYVKTVVNYNEAMKAINNLPPIKQKTFLLEVINHILNEQKQNQILNKANQTNN